jgi:hypothetical protein
MITHKVVLILGAGASMPFGFPSGYELKTQITHDLNPAYNRIILSNIHDAGFSPQEIEAFRTALQKSGKRSVDAFLEHRPEFLKVGKTATACVLMPCENEERLFAEGQASWYEYFFNKLNARFEEFEKNSVSVLTFNYDRSLEQYLITALRNAYGKTSEECAEKLRSLPIVHLYGQLGELPSMSGEGIEYGAPVNTQNLTRSAEAIQIIHEDVKDKPQFQRAYELLQNADRICFVGFGYDETNLQRLSGYGPRRHQVLFACAKGLTGRECYLIQDKLKALGYGERYSLDNLGDALEFLRNNCPFD